MGFLNYISTNNDIRAIVGSIMLICLLLCILTCNYKFAVCQENINKNKVIHSSGHHKICNNRNDMINLHNNNLNNL
uniref:Uncharacterized protein n=1 Tax=viral metagenome TaxID=1070528 RepID=A0A6C0CYD2_9ZZZZ